MNFNIIVDNSEKYINKLYGKYKKDCLEINNIDTANGLVNLEYKKINQYLYSIETEISTNIQEELIREFNVSKVNKFENIDINIKKVPKINLDKNSLYIIEKQVKNINKSVNSSKKNNDASMALIGGVAGAIIGGTVNFGGKEVVEVIKNTSIGALGGTVIGTIGGIVLGNLFNSSDKEKDSKNDMNNSKIREIKKFNNKVLIEVFQKREKFILNIVKEYVINTSQIYEEFLREC